MKSNRSDRVFDAIHDLMHLYRSRQYRVLRDGPYDLTHMEFKVLSFFTRRPGSTQSDLVQHTGRDKAQIARLIQALRNRGLLDAQADPLDKRFQRLHPTEAGLAMQQAIEEEGRVVSRQAIHDLSAQECDTLVALLERIQHNLDS
ncbi:MAG: Transcriptional regulator HosA [Pseudomonas citronellolis]|nr:MAG: Transcriptional regulator HosA [Pseudomonas citronellolis]